MNRPPEGDLRVRIALLVCLAVCAVVVALGRIRALVLP